MDTISPAPASGSAYGQAAACPISLKEKGNAKVQAKDWRGAIEDYDAATAAIRAGGSKESRGILATVLSNRALCWLKLGDWAAAAADSSAALAIDGSLKKALFRRAQAADGLGDVSTAMSSLKALIELEPHNSAAIHLTHDLRERHGLGKHQASAPVVAAAAASEKSGQPPLKELTPQQLAELRERGLLCIYEDDPDYDEVVLGMPPGGAVSKRHHHDFRPWEVAPDPKALECGRDSKEAPATPDAGADAASPPLPPQQAANTSCCWSVPQDFVPPASTSGVAARTGWDEKTAPVLPPRQRNFTLRQLSEYDGSDGNKPIYISLGQQVHDVTKGRSFYGPGQAYHLFAGHDVTRALARMSFDLKDIDNFNLDDLAPTERKALNGWMENYGAKYPVVGRLVLAPPQDLQLTREELRCHDGSAAQLPEGYAAAPIYLAVSGDVFDVSFGGSAFFGPDGPYSALAGRDGTMALAKMSLQKVDSADGGEDPPLLSPEESKRLRQWTSRFRSFKRYPVVGKLVG